MRKIWFFTCTSQKLENRSGVKTLFGGRLFVNALLLFTGQKLLRKADFHLGQVVNTFFRIKCKMGELGEDRKHITGADKRHITMFGKLKFQIFV